MKSLSKMLLGLSALALTAGVALVKPVPAAAFPTVSFAQTSGAKTLNYWHHRYYHRHFYHRHYHHSGIVVHL